MLVQRIPPEGGKAALVIRRARICLDEDRSRACSDSRPADLLEDDVEQRLVHMFGVDEVRVFTGHTVTFRVPLQPRTRRQRVLGRWAWRKCAVSSTSRAP